MKTRSTNRKWTTATVGSLLAALGLVGAAAARSPEVQWWKGTIEVPGQPLDFVVVFRATGEAGQYTATIDIPAQGAKGLALAEVSLTQAEIHFRIPPPADAVFETRRSDDGRTATGQMTQHGMTYALRMEQITEDEAKAVGPPRPQTPRPPFPYTVREVTYENPVDGTKLAATLTIPEGPGPHPAVILITGSGAQDRDETIFGHKPFFVLADHLTRGGVAVLRVDDRGVGGSSGGDSQPTSKDFANDVVSGIKFLKGQPEIDPGRIGLIGHSEGGIIAPLVASRSKDVDCIVLLAGPGLPGEQILKLQQEAIVRAAGVPDDRCQELLRAQEALFELLRAEADEPAIRTALREYVRCQLGLLGTEPAPEQIQQGVKLGMAQFGSPWMRWFMRHDPREVLSRVKCPVLALIGSLDLQIPAKDNLPEIERTLRQANNPDVTVKQLPGLNHLFQEARTGLPAEYGLIEQTIAPAVLDEIATWLRRRFRLQQ
jgi:hypothetical protein